MHGAYRQLPDCRVSCDPSPSRRPPRGHGLKPCRHTDTHGDAHGLHDLPEASSCLSKCHFLDFARANWDSRDWELLPVSLHDWLCLRPPLLIAGVLSETPRHRRSAERSYKPHTHTHTAMRRPCVAIIAAPVDSPDVASVPSASAQASLTLCTSVVCTSTAGGLYDDAIHPSPFSFHSSLPSESHHTARTNSPVRPSAKPVDVTQHSLQPARATQPCHDCMQPTYAL